MDLAYRRAKAVKAVKKAADAGKIVQKKSKQAKRPSQTTQSRTEEMHELFQSEMSEKKQKRNLRGGGGAKKKSSFKSKSRYAFCSRVPILIKESLFCMCCECYMKYKSWGGSYVFCLGILRSCMLQCLPNWLDYVGAIYFLAISLKF